MSKRPEITPEMTVGELLDAYPKLEATLIELAPTFQKLSNPELRSTVAKVTSLGHVASVGELLVGAVITRVRQAAGCDGSCGNAAEAAPERAPSGWMVSE
jgi:hypothetical protein